MPPKTRAKFECTGVTKRKGWNGASFVYEASFQPVVGGSPENDQFYAATPGGEIRLSTLREDHFQVGKSYYVDFMSAD